MSLMHTICVVSCWRSNFRLVIVAPLAVKINAPGTPSSFKRGRYPACYNQPLLQPAPVSPTFRNIHLRNRWYLITHYIALNWAELGHRWLRILMTCLRTQVRVRICNIGNDEIYHNILGKKGNKYCFSSCRQSLFICVQIPYFQWTDLTEPLIQTGSSDR